MAGTRNVSSRSRTSQPPVCGFTLDGRSCRKRGDHFCTPRADKAQKFFEEILVHTKGRYARQRFVPAKWQRDEIIRPIFGTVRWSVEHEEYVRVYLIVWVELARKNGKTELLAGIMLYLLVADGEESAEIYGCARDRDQASLAFDVAMRMVQLSPILSRRLTVRAHLKRIIDPRTNSFYQVIAADAAGALGSNPSGVAADEILAWRDRSMWDAQRTGMGSGARRQPLMVAATTAGNDPSSFRGKAMHDGDATRSPTTPPGRRRMFVYMRNTPAGRRPVRRVATGRMGNPALGDVPVPMRRCAKKPSRRATTRPRRTRSGSSGSTSGSIRPPATCRLHQWDQQRPRDLPLNPGLGAGRTQGPHLHGPGSTWPRSSTCPLGALIFPAADGQPVRALWRFWLPEAIVPASRQAHRREDLGQLGPPTGGSPQTDGDVHRLRPGLRRHHRRRHGVRHPNSAHYDRVEHRARPPGDRQAHRHGDVRVRVRRSTA
jgi:hypothetical protein